MKEPPLDQSSPRSEQEEEEEEEVSPREAEVRLWPSWQTAKTDDWKGQPTVCLVKRTGGESWVWEWDRARDWYVESRS